eukprot:1104021-Pyramimonas_sp.AAC.1
MRRCRAKVQRPSIPRSVARRQELKSAVEGQHCRAARPASKWRRETGTSETGTAARQVTGATERRA